jgi:pimeloyl-ACP methyl ester carboxylesterase
MMTKDIHMAKMMLSTAMLGVISLCSACATPQVADALGADLLTVESHTLTLEDGTALATERGSFMVPEDRSDPKSRQIEIGFTRFLSTNPNPGRPIVYLAGGPGGSGVDAASGPRQPIFLALRAVADVIALDQRGTGVSNHIPSCTAPERPTLSATIAEQTMTAYYRETLQHCVAQWSEAGVALNGYTTEESAHDIEMLRRAIGAEKLDLWAISYGTHLALAYMRQFPDSVGRAAFASAEGMNQTVKLPAHIDSAFERIGEYLNRNGATATPDHLPALMRRVHARFDSDPQSFTMKSAHGDLTFEMDSFPLRMMASFLPKNPSGIPQLLGLYKALDAGERDAFASLFYNSLLARPLVMTGMPELMDMASGITGPRMAQVKAQSTRSLTGTAANFPMPQLQGAIPEVDLGELYRQEVSSAVPTLLISGDLDVRTPLEEQLAATRGLANLHHVIVRNGGHDLFEAHPEVPGLLLKFFSGEPITTGELVLAEREPGAPPSPSGTA